ncbi:MAG: ATP-binding cassette domain-containing protein, partial [Alphaproteobacteria bacterium]|nr:ATP-binding cassette domain-containing protein [Alphaproteobacteria bacterium]
MTTTADIIVSVEDVHAGYTPGVDILRGLSLQARTNAITLVIGPNGAGKSTLLRAIFGFLTPGAGTIRFKGSDTTGLKPSDLKLAGVSYVTQDINSFPHLTVEENLRMGAWVFRRDKARLARQLERVYATFPALTPKRGDRAGSLSGGQGRMLSVAREMMSEPTLLLIDEPTVGLAPNLVEQVYEILATARKATGAAILLVEQNVEQALPL